MGKPSKEKDNLKVICEETERERYHLQKKLFAFQEEVDKLKFIQEDENVHGSPTSLAAKSVELQSSLGTKTKFYEEANNASMKMTYRIDKVVKALWQNKEPREEEHEVYKG